MQPNKLWHNINYKMHPILKMCILELLIQSTSLTIFNFILTKTRSFIFNLYSSSVLGLLRQNILIRASIQLSGLWFYYWCLFWVFASIFLIEI